MSNAIRWLALAALLGALLVAPSGGHVLQARAAAGHMAMECADRQICADVQDPAAFSYAGYSYVGHDEPSLLFYSGTAGARNSYISRLTLPTDPPNQPTQNGSGGTFHLQLHPASAFCMAPCDDPPAP